MMPKISSKSIHKAMRQRRNLLLASFFTETGAVTCILDGEFGRLKPLFRMYARERLLAGCNEVLRLCLFVLLFCDLISDIQSAQCSTRIGRINTDNSSSNSESCAVFAIWDLFMKKGG